MSLNMDEARRREAREKYIEATPGPFCEECHANIDLSNLAHESIPDALDDIDTLLARLKGLLLAVENHAHVHQPSPMLQVEMERVRTMLDEAEKGPMVRGISV